MKIIVPMAGIGSRLRPHTLTIPKPFCQYIVLFTASPRSACPEQVRTFLKVLRLWGDCKCWQFVILISFVPDTIPTFPNNDNINDVGTLHFQFQPHIYIYAYQLVGCRTVNVLIYTGLVVDMYIYMTCMCIQICIHVMYTYAAHIYI